MPDASSGAERRDSIAAALREFLSDASPVHQRSGDGTSSDR